MGVLDHDSSGMQEFVAIKAEALSVSYLSKAETLSVSYLSEISLHAEWLGIAEIQMAA